MIDMTVTVQRLTQLLEERQTHLYDQVHPASQVHFQSFSQVGIDGHSYQLTRSAQRLFAQKLRVPIEYLLRCPEDLQEVNLNYWVESLGETPLFVRFEEEQVRAVFSLRYKPIDHVEIAERLKQSFPGEKKVRFSLSDELLLIKLIDVLENFKTDQDEFSPGVAIVNSETGYSAFSIEGFFLRLVCTNGLIAETAVSNRTRHIKENALENFDQLVSTVYLEAGNLRDKLRISMDREVDNPAATFANFSKRFGLIRKEEEAVVQAWDGGRTMFSIINAYTSAANRPALPLEEVYRFQRIGGMILSMVK
jgi:hypothetical protein